MWMAVALFKSPVEDKHDEISKVLNQARGYCIQDELHNVLPWYARTRDKQWKSERDIACESMGKDPQLRVLHCTYRC